MSMDLNCERAMGLIIPAVRISVSKKLRKEGMAQAEISRRLGIRQATVSKYLTGKYSSRLKAAERIVDSKGISANVAGLIIRGSGPKQVSAVLDAIAFRKDVILAASRIA